MSMKYEEIHNLCSYRKTKINTTDILSHPNQKCGGKGVFKRVTLYIVDEDES